jgi:hypothetical protein
MPYHARISCHADTDSSPGYMHPDGILLPSAILWGHEETASGRLRNVVQSAQSSCTIIKSLHFFVDIAL